MADLTGPDMGALEKRTDILHYCAFVNGMPHP